MAGRNEKLVLTNELLELPRKFDEFVKEDFKPLKRRVDKIERDVSVLKQDVAILKQDVAVLKQDVADLKKRVRKLEIDVAELKGDNFERKVREKAVAYFGRVLRKVKVIDQATLGLMLDDGLDKGVITEDEKMEIAWADGVIKGRMGRDGKEAWIIFEASYVVGKSDVDRAKRRAAILQKLVGRPVIAVVVGKSYAIPRDEVEALGVVPL